MATRNVAFFTMIVVGLLHAVRGAGFDVGDTSGSHIAANFSGMGSLYGATVYSFMCHHSLPSIITPIKHKRNLTRLFLVDYIFIALCYTLLCMSALFAFGTEQESDCPSHPSHPCKLQSLYTLNFSSYHIRPIADYLTLFPCFTLTTNYPLIAITLRNNLQTLWASFFDSSESDSAGQSTVTRGITPVSASSSSGGSGTGAGIEIPLLASASGSSSNGNPAADAAATSLARQRIYFAAAAAIPPIGLACATSHLDALVSFTGAFAGVAIQFLIPTALVYYSRRSVIGDDAEASALLSSEFPAASGSGGGNGITPTSSSSDVGLPIGKRPRNIHRSPFTHVGWCYGMFAWSAISLVANIILQIQKLS